MDDLAVHTHTKTLLRQFIAEPTHALLMVGPAGLGKRALAEALLAEILSTTIERFSSHPYTTVITPDEKGTISIEAIRNVQKFLQLKTTGTEKFRRFVIIDQAQGLTIEAQNAFLKLLEEPPADTLLVLTANSKRALLPTILSRAQTVSILAPEESTLSSFFKNQGKDEAAISQARLLSGGLPGLMSALLNDEAEHPLVASVRTAKELLQKTTFERLVMVESLAKQKTETAHLLDALLRISMSAQTQAVNKQDAARLKQWHNIRKEVVSAQIALSQSANAKLVLSKMLLHV